MVTKSWLLAIIGLAASAGAAQDQISKISTLRPERRAAAARDVEYLVSPSARFDVSYDRAAIVPDAPSVIQVAEHQAGVIGLPMEVMRGKAPIVPASLPSGQRPAFFGHLGPTLGAWFWQLVPGIGAGWDGEPMHGTVPPILLKPSAAIAAPKTPQVSVSIDKDNSSRIRIKVVSADHVALFDAIADNITMNSTDFGRIVLNGNVEINSHKKNEPARILGAAAIINLNGGTIEMMSQAGDGR